MEWGHKGIMGQDVRNRRLAPIVLFVYNRLDHTIKTIEALQKNELAELSDLYIYSDGPKTHVSSCGVQAVREYIKTIRGFKSIEIIEREENWGLARNIIDGVTSIINHYGKIIVLEDDLVTAKYFLRYMNDALDFYKEAKRVMQIAGYMFPINPDNISETFFLRAPDCWGWATWKDRWQYFERNPDKLISEFSNADIYRFNFDGAYNFWSQVKDNLSGKIYTWAIFWYASVFKMGGLALYPRKSLVFNTGLDLSGVHCSTTKIFDVMLNNEPVKIYATDIKEDKQAFYKIQVFLQSTVSNGGILLVKRVWNKIKRALSSL